QAHGPACRRAGARRAQPEALPACAGLANAGSLEGTLGSRLHASCAPFPPGGMPAPAGAAGNQPCSHVVAGDLPLLCQHSPAAARKASEPARPLPRRFIFAPFQLAADTQIVAFSPWIRDMHEFHAVLGELQARLRRAGSDLEVVVKEHPSSPVNYADLHGQRGVTFANHWPPPDVLATAAASLTRTASGRLNAR